MPIEQQGQPDKDPDPVTVALIVDIIGLAQSRHHDGQMTLTTEMADVTHHHFDMAIHGHVEAE